MSKAAIQASVLNNGSSLTVAANAQITVRNLAGSIVVLYSTREGTGNPGNPFNANSNGYFLVYADPGVYDITVTTSGGSQVYKHVVALAEAIGISGTYTPALTFGGLSTGITYGTNHGGYTKKPVSGGLSEVFVQSYMVLSNKGTATGAATITLPFTVYTQGGLHFPAAALRFNRVTYSGSFHGYGNGGSILLGQLPETGIVGTLSDANFSDVSSVVFSMTYLTQD